VFLKGGREWARSNGSMPAMGSESRIGAVGLRERERRGYVGQRGKGRRGGAWKKEKKEERKGQPKVHKQRKERGTQSGRGHLGGVPEVRQERETNKDIFLLSVRLPGYLSLSLSLSSIAQAGARPLFSLCVSE